MKAQLQNRNTAISIIALPLQTKLHTAKKPLGIRKASAEGRPIDLARKMSMAGAGCEHLEDQQNKFT